MGTEKTGKGDPLKMINMYCSVLVLNCGAGYLEDFLDSSEQCGQTPGPAQSDSQEDGETRWPSWEEGGFVWAKKHACETMVVKQYI